MNNALGHRIKGSPGRCIEQPYHEINERSMGRNGRAN